MGVVFGFVLSLAARNKMADDLSLPINNKSHFPLHLQHLPEEEEEEEEEEEKEKEGEEVEESAGGP